MICRCWRGWPFRIRPLLRGVVRWRVLHGDRGIVKEEKRSCSGLVRKNRKGRRVSVALNKSFPPQLLCRALRKRSQLALSRHGLRDFKISGTQTA